MRRLLLPYRWLGWALLMLSWPQLAMADPALIGLQSILNDLRAGRLIQPAHGPEQAKRQMLLLQALDVELQNQIARLHVGHAPHTSSMPTLATTKLPGTAPVSMLWPIAHLAGPLQTAPGPALYLPSALGASVRAGCLGKILYAGPFRSYGQLAILDCGGDTKLVLGGMARLQVSVGKTIRQGQALGLMPHDAGPPPRLYLEVRRGDALVDPQIFFHTKGRTGLIDSARSGVR